MTRTREANVIATGTPIGANGDEAAVIETTAGPSYNEVSESLEDAQITNDRMVIEETPVSDDEVTKDRLRALRIKKRKAKRQAVLRQLLTEEANGFREGSVEPGTRRDRLDKDQLATLAKDVKRPEIFTGQSQRHLDKFLRQLHAVFRTEPTIFASEEARCVYAGEFLGDRPADKWVAIDQFIRDDPTESYSWHVFVDMLQQNLLPRALWEFRLNRKLKELKQRDNQSVGEFIAYFNKLADQFQEKLSDSIERFFIMTGVHQYLMDALILRDRLGTTREELEEALRSIEWVEPAPPGITIKMSYKLGRGDSTFQKPTHTKSSNTRAKSGVERRNL